jgi:hypothetical protein
MPLTKSIHMEDNLLLPLLLLRSVDIASGCPHINNRHCERDMNCLKLELWHIIHSLIVITAKSLAMYYDYGSFENK